MRAAARGERAFCSWDEDAITMAVEAGRDCLKNVDPKSIGRITLASTTSPFADLQGSAIAAGALRLEESTASMDIANSQRAATSGFVQTLQSAQSALFIASERPVAKPASPQELGFGAGAVAFVTGAENVIVKFLASATVTANFVDHYVPQRRSTITTGKIAGSGMKVLTNLQSRRRLQLLRKRASARQK